MVVWGRGMDANGDEIIGDARPRYVVFPEVSDELLQPAAWPDLLRDLENTANGTSVDGPRRADRLPNFLEEMMAHPPKTAGPKPKAYPEWRRDKQTWFLPAMLILFVAVGLSGGCGGRGDGEAGPLSSPSSNGRGSPGSSCHIRTRRYPTVSPPGGGGRGITFGELKRRCRTHSCAHTPLSPQCAQARAASRRRPRLRHGPECRRSDSFSASVVAVRSSRTPVRSAGPVLWLPPGGPRNPEAEAVSASR